VKIGHPKDPQYNPPTKKQMANKLELFQSKVNRITAKIIRMKLRKNAGFINKMSSKFRKDLIVLGVCISALIVGNGKTLSLRTRQCCIWVVVMVGGVFAI
jgi:hypothetical protein